MLHLSNKNIKCIIMIKLSHVIWIAILTCFVSLSVNGQVKCSNKLLSELLDQLPALQGSSTHEMLVTDISKSKPIIVERNKDGVVSHIGIKFFDRSFIQKFPSPVYHFVERYFLELLLLPSVEEMERKMRMEHVTITSEVISLEDLKAGLQKIVADVPRDFSVYITSNNNYYSASCLDGNKLLARIRFPVRYELISGYTKLEAESSVYPELLSQLLMDLKPLPPSYMTPYKDDMFCTNEDYYVTEDIISNTYYKKVEDDYVPVFSTEALKESVHNLFNSGYDWGAVAEVEQDMYGGKKNTFEVPLAKLVCFLLNKDCNIYSGIRKYDKKMIDGIMMAVNTELGYQHIVMFSLNKDILDNPTMHKVKVKMYSYVPIHNISSLF